MIRVQGIVNSKHLQKKGVMEVFLKLIKLDPSSYQVHLGLHKVVKSGLPIH